MNKFYSDEKNIQILIALLKAHAIKYVVASPGNTNLTLVASLQQDPFFTIYSSVDERSAAYLACGISEETGEPVMLSCTGATASRNYMPGLTEAYYRHLPVLAVTSSRVYGEIGQLIPQVIDRRIMPNDIAKLSVQLPVVKDEQDAWECNLKVNQAILELTRCKCGPVHINIPTIYCPTYNTKELPEQRVINRIEKCVNMPSLDKKKVAIFVGSHERWNKQLVEAVERFCECYDSMLVCDHTSAYHGKYRVQFSLIGGQEQLVNNLNQVDVLIHIGQTSGDYFSSIGKFNMSQVWRVCADGEIHDTFRKLRYVFEMDELEFFNYYNNKKPANSSNIEYYKSCHETYDRLVKCLADNIDKMPFSNIWIARQTAGLIPENSEIHFSILSSLRSWNFFELPQGVDSFCNVGGFGIDGCVSSLIGASLISQDKIYFGIIGDLAYFYDLNSLGNRHIGKNVRIILVNNGIGAEFKLSCYPGAKLGDDSNAYIAAEGHFAKKSQELVKHFMQDLGFEYLSASSKEEYLKYRDYFLDSKPKDKSILLEVFTSYQDESDALEVIRNLESNMLGSVKKSLSGVLGENTKQILRKIVKR